jgi:quercetin dioxygenase-like cupin family protein
MQHWNVTEMDVQAHHPVVISSTGDVRTIVLHLPAGERLQEHETYERALLMVVTGTVELGDAGGGTLTGGPGLLAHFAPHERREVRALEDARIVLLLAPWPAADRQLQGAG